MADIKKFDQYESSEITKVDTRRVEDSLPVMNNRRILNWLVDCQTKAFQDKKKSLTTVLINELTNLFGAPNRSMRLEYMTKVWVLEYHGITFNVFSANKKGTGIEVAGIDFEQLRTGEKADEIIEFLEKLYESINK